MLKYCHAGGLLIYSFWFSTLIYSSSISSSSAHDNTHPFLNSEMSDSADMNLNNIPQFATDSGDANTGKHNPLLQQLHISPYINRLGGFIGIYLDELLCTHAHDGFMVEMDDGQVSSNFD